MNSTRRRSRLAALASAVVAGATVLTGAEGASAFEGSWRATGALNQARIAQKSVLLGDGRVLVTAGRTASAALTSSELYDPLTEAFSTTGPLTTSRWSHTATLLADGRVLAAGGFTGLATGNAQAVTDTAEIYDPATGTWSATAPMATRRALHVATLLDDGLVLVAGGRTCDGPPPATCDFTVRTDTAEVYDPATGTWSPTNAMSAPRHTTSAAKLLDGRVLVPAGFSNEEPHETNRTADLYDPATGTWTLTGDLQVSRARQGAMRLPGGSVVVGPGSRTTTCGPPVCQNGAPRSRP